MSDPWKTRLEAARFEAERFLKRVDEALKVDSSPWSQPKETGAVKRASMDLTRALADVRRPRY